PTAVNLGGYRHDRRQLQFQDIVIGLAHPLNYDLGLPNCNEFRLAQLVIGELHRRGAEAIDLREVATLHGVSVNRLAGAMKRAPIYGDGLRFVEVSGGLVDTTVTPHEFIPKAQRVGLVEGTIFKAGYTNASKAWTPIDVRTSWQFTVSLFESICDRLFRKKSPDAMIYSVE